MRILVRVIVPLLAIAAAGFAQAQITGNPIPDRIEKRGLAIEIVEVARLPDTRGIRPPEEDVKPAGWARINYVRDLPDGRRFANDSRGFLYRLDAGNQPHVYANVAETFPHAVYNRLSSGFTLSSRRTASSTRCTGSAGRETRRRPTSSRPATG
jgi:hypothetical protein